MVLPTPLELAALGAGLLIAGGLVVWFLHMFELGVIVCVAGVAVLGAASVAGEYETMGENKIKPQLVALQAKVDEAEARAQKFFADAQAAVKRANEAALARNRAIDAMKVAVQEKIRAQSEAVRNIPIPADAGSVLQPAIDAANAGSAVASDLGSQAAAAATVAGDTTLGAVEEWAGTVIGLYASCTSQVAGLQGYVNALVAASPDEKKPAQGGLSLFGL